MPTSWMLLRTTRHPTPFASGKPTSSTATRPSVTLEPRRRLAGPFPGYYRAPGRQNPTTGPVSPYLSYCRSLARQWRQLFLNGASQDLGNGRSAKCSDSGCPSVEPLNRNAAQMDTELALEAYRQMHSRIQRRGAPVRRSIGVADRALT